MKYQNITEAGDGAEAWNVIQAEASSPQPFEFIFSDIMMPEMTGLELLKAVRENALTKALPVLLVTSQGEVDAVVGAAALKVDGYVMKPMDKTSISKQMERIWKVRNG
jgi:two-component system chemotaxis response regulator CheY